MQQKAAPWATRVLTRITLVYNELAIEDELSIQRNAVATI